MRLNIILATALVATIAMPAEAYVGPGLGLGALGVVVGLLLSVFMALFAFVWMPLKRLFTGRTAGMPAEIGDDA
jgi:hypothetical protein